MIEISIDLLACHTTAEQVAAWNFRSTGVDLKAPENLIIKFVASPFTL
jgi:hypothetical protein